MPRKTAPASPPVARASDLPGDASPFALGLLLRRAHDRAAAPGGGKGSLGRVGGGLEGKGLVARPPVPGDRRVHAIEMTPRGLEVFDAIHPPAPQIADPLTGHLPPRDADQLRD